jgi:tetratricopeptide (TPR) repeat protein
VASTRHALARALETIGELDAALGEYERALLLLEQLHGSGRATSLVGSHIGALLARRGRCDQAWAPLTRAVDDARADAPGSLSLALALEAQSQACVSSHPDALMLAHEAVAIRERLQGLNHPDLAGPLAVGALALLIDADDPAAALALIDRAQQLLDSATLEPAGARSDLARISAARGLTLIALRRDDEARAPLERAHAQLDPATELAAWVSRALAEIR